MFSDEDLSLLTTDQFATKLQAYCKSRLKSKVSLVTAVISYLQQLDTLLKGLRAGSHRYKAVQRRLCIGITDLSLTLIHSKDWQSLETVLTTLIPTEDLVGLVSLYCPTKMSEVYKELPKIKEYIDNNLAAVITFSKAEDCPTELIEFYKSIQEAKNNELQIAVLRQELSRLGLDKNALQNLIKQL